MAATRNMARTLIIGNRGPNRQALAESIEATRLFGQVLQANNVTEAENRMVKKPIDMIFLDTEGMDRGFPWLRSLGRSEQRDIPVLSFIAGDDENGRIAALESGSADCLAYSTSPKELAARIRRHLETKERIDQLRQAKSDLEQQAITDPLTGLCNRGFFNLTLDSEAARSHRTRKPFSLMMVDLDHFKAVNDTFGHQVGDALLQEVAGALRASIRKSDVVCRYGGEEFALILPGARTANARSIAERIHRKIAAACRNCPSLDMPVTVSIGISSSPGTSFVDPSQILQEADQALYAAKDRGRNRTEVFEKPRLFTGEEFAPHCFSPFPHPA